MHVDRATGLHEIVAGGVEAIRPVADPGLDGVTGAYFEGARRIRSSRDSYDEAKAADLWQVSERLVPAVH